MKKLLFIIITLLLIIPAFVPDLYAQEFTDVAQEASTDEGLHQTLKVKFIEGSALFMSFVAMALIIGMAFCLERIIYLNLIQINPQKLTQQVENALEEGNLDYAKDICRNTRGPIASIFYQGLLRMDQGIDAVEKTIVSYGGVQAGLLEKGLSWITLFITMAPSLGFLGTVIGMIEAFDNIQQTNDMSAEAVAGGIKIALITTVGGLIVALILQLFYNYILSKVESILNEMEDSSISLMDIVVKYSLKYKK